MPCDRINEMIKKICDTCLPWLMKDSNGNYLFIDPIDGEEISAHYGATHFAAALILYGKKNSDSNLSKKGFELLDSILLRWEYSSKLAGFHNDFNNFALCVIMTYLSDDEYERNFSEKIKNVVMKTPDSNNPTVNWFPMRWYVNDCRYKWSGDNAYKEKCDKCKEDIKNATYDDGYIDDRIPKGISYNLQYNVTTVAALQFLRSQGEAVDVSVELAALLNIVYPDGDINYFGRGTNQVFAWGPWIYLLASSGQEKECEEAVNYLYHHIDTVLENNNLLLNDYDGREKYLWWDYHYCSVYTAHLMLWLVLAVEQAGKYPISPILFKEGNSGIKVYKDNDSFLVTFAGRKEYLSEKGDSIAAIWTKKAGTIIKGYFGPWKGAFGKKHFSPETVIRNYCGLFAIETGRNDSNNRYLNRIMQMIPQNEEEMVRPLFIASEVEINDEYVDIVWKTRTEVFLNIPVLSACFTPRMCSVFIDEAETLIHNQIKIKNQYGWIKLYQTDIHSGNKWVLRFYK